MSYSHVSFWRVLAGFSAAFIVLIILGMIVGIESVVGGLAGTDRRLATGSLGAVALWLTMWGLSLYVVLRKLQVTVTSRRAVLLYASATFLNGMTPFGQLGGEVLSGAIISRSTDAEYETGVAAMMAVDLINLLPSPLLAFVGVVLLVVSGEWNSEFRVNLVMIFGALTAVVAGIFLWRFRTDARRSLSRFSMRVFGASNRLIGRVLLIDMVAFSERVESFLTEVRRVFDNRGGLMACFGLSSLGWLGLVLAFWLSLRAVGHPVSFELVVFVLPVGMIASAVPLPGGVGAVEAAFIGLLVAVGGVPVVSATAGVVLYRGVAYWTPLLFGGIVTAVLYVAHPSPRSN